DALALLGRRSVRLLVRQLRALPRPERRGLRLARPQARPDRPGDRRAALEGRGRARARRRARTRRRGRGSPRCRAGGRRPAVAGGLGGLRARPGLGAGRPPERVGRAAVVGTRHAAPYANRRRRSRSARGAHQFHSPRIAISDGTSSARTMLASIATAAAVPTPSSWTNTRRDVANEPIATQKSRAAAVTMRPVRSSPAATAAVLDSPRACGSWMRESRKTA